MTEAELKAWAEAAAAVPENSGSVVTRINRELGIAVLALIAERDVAIESRDAAEAECATQCARANAAEARLAEMEIDRNLWRDGQVAMEARLAEVSAITDSWEANHVGGDTREARTVLACCRTLRAVLAAGKPG